MKNSDLYVASLQGVFGSDPTRYTMPVYESGSTNALCQGDVVWFFFPMSLKMESSFLSADGLTSRRPSHPMLFRQKEGMVSWWCGTLKPVMNGGFGVFQKA